MLEAQVPPAPTYKGRHTSETLDTVQVSLQSFYVKTLIKGIYKETCVLFLVFLSTMKRQKGTPHTGHYHMLKAKSIMNSMLSASLS